MSISASAIKELREQTSAGMMDCKKALTENNGDFEAAKDWLRSKGLAKAAKKAARVASEGLVAIHAEGSKVAIIEFNSETDFVAKNDQFQALTKDIAKAAVSTDGEIENIKKQTLETTGKTVEESVTDAIAKIGENMNLRRAEVIETNGGEIFTYIHSAVADNLGKIGVVVSLKNGNAELGKQIAMHIAASKPEALVTGDVDPENLEREKQIFSEQARESGKPENIIEKMVEGRIRKYYEQIVLTEQAFVMDPNKKVKDVLKEEGAEIESYVQFTLGEGIEKEESDFAAEVQAAVNG
jgi:elongation factor Ts